MLSDLFGTVWGMTPDRHLPHPLLFNLRDVGGYRTVDGRQVRWRRLLRSDSLHRLAEIEPQFAELGIRTVIDLRRPREVEQLGRVPAYPGLAYHNIAPEHAEWTDLPYDDTAGHARWLADRYLDLARDGAEGLAEAITLISDPEAAPVVVHCAAGKDRTGVVCGLTLATLGVSDVDIAGDYALSTAASEAFTAWVRQTLPDHPETPQQMLSSPTEAMHLFLRDLRAEYGSVELYLKDAGVSEAALAALREHLLE